MGGVNFGLNGNGLRKATPADEEGNLGIAIRSPRNPFGSLWVEGQHPVFQSDGVYGVNQISMRTGTTSGGSATSSNSLLVCTTGTSVGGSGYIQSRKRLRYRAGQGIISRFTAMFTTGVASSYQVIGLGHAEDYVCFGYRGTGFGVLVGVRGVREVQTLTITTKSSHAENAVVTLNGVAHNIAVTNGASTVTTAAEIAAGTYTGWTAESIGSTVVFVADSVGDKASTFSITGTSVQGSFVETQAGAAATETFVAQTAWNSDRMDGTGPSGMTADWTKLNVFKIHLQYLGAGAFEFFVEAPNGQFVKVHTIENANTLTASTLGNPSMPFLMSAYSAGSTTNLTIKCASFAGFYEGERHLHGPRLSYAATSTAITNSAYGCLFTFRNSRYFNSRVNQSVINVLSIAAAVKHTQPVIIYLVKNATLAGSPNFALFSSGKSCSTYDTAATTCTFTNDQLIWSGALGETGDLNFAFTDEITLQPGETLTACAKAVTGSPAYVSVSVNTREDQ